MTYYVIIRGPAGVGKTTVADQVAKAINGEHISVDKVLDENKLTEDKEEGYISQKSFLKANEIVLPKVLEVLKSKPVVFDGNFYWKSQVEDLVAKLDYSGYVFTLKAHCDDCIVRDKSRSKAIGEDAIRAVYKAVARFDHGTNIDTANKTSETVVKEIISYLP